jgi:hypothetical protein
MLARERVGAARPEDHRAVGEPVRGADDRADVAGVLHGVQPDAQVAARRRPALLVDADHAGARAERADRVEQLRLHVLAGAQHEARIPAGPLGGGHEVLALGGEQAQLLAPALGRELADRLELVVVG